MSSSTTSPTNVEEQLAEHKSIQTTTGQPKRSGFSISNFLEQPDEVSASPATSVSSETDSAESSQTPTPIPTPPPAGRRDDPNGRPTLSYNALIALAIQSHPEKRMVLSEIYEFIAGNFPYYRNRERKGWENSIRHNLSLHREFIKEPKENGKGSYWTMTNADMYIEENGKLRRRSRNRPAAPAAAAHPIVPQMPMAPLMMPPTPFPSFPFIPMQIDPAVLQFYMSTLQQMPIPGLPPFPSQN